MKVSDVVVSKAGPGTIFEAVAASVSLLVTEEVGLQERGNIALATALGAVRAPLAVDLDDALRWTRERRRAGGVSPLRAPSRSGDELTVVDWVAGVREEITPLVPTTRPDAAGPPGR